MSSNNIVDSISEPYIDGLLVLSDPSYPSLELFCANTILSPPSDHELSTYSCNNHLLEAAFDYSLVPCLDHSSPKPSINHRKRCASIDLADVFNQSDGGWRINDEISANLQDQVQMINGDILKDYLLIDDDYAPNTAVISANYDCSDLEDVLDFLLKESDTVSTQSVMPRLENSLSLRDSTNQAEPDGDPSSGFHNIEKEKEDGGENRARWQGKQAGEIRTSWQQIQGGGEVRASWQQKQGAGEIRASWQPPTSEQGRCREGGPSPQLQDIGGPRGSSSAVWAGPTLMDIESALATRGSPTHHNSSIAISSDSSTASSTVLGETDPQEKITSFFDVRKLLTDELPMCKKQLLEKHNLGVSWRLKLLKRNHLEPKHSIKVRREEGAAGDGYRWRKYGQKNIKNVPFPRSYYKCSSGKCNAKKQVERCHEDDELLLVTYEGIHLHHRPNPIRPIGMLVEH